MNKMKEYIIIDNGDIYSIPGEMTKCIKAAYDLVKATDEDMTCIVNTVIKSCIVNTVIKYGEFVGSAILTIRT